MGINSDFIKTLEGDSEKIITDFLEKIVGEGSRENYSSAILQIFKQSNKKNVHDLSYEDYYPIYEKILNHDTKNRTQNFYKVTFFKYIYLNDIISSEKFTWIKKELEMEFEDKIEKDTPTPKEKTEKRVLSLTEIFKVQEKLAKEHPTFESLREELLWYLLFETDFSVVELRQMKSNQFQAPYIKTKTNQYRIPEKFSVVFETLSKKKYNGFQNLKSIIPKLGEKVGISDLIPQVIKNTQKANTLTCSNCGTSYINTINNWKSVQNRIICTTCADILKKKYNLKSNHIMNENLEVVSDTTLLETASDTFQELINKLPRTIDYLKLHEYNMHIGKLGEDYAYNYELERLKGSKYRELVDKSKAADPKNGYDILSYNPDGTELFIEVKTSVEGLEKDFYITSNELKTAKELRLSNKKYLIYRIGKILEDKENIELKEISDIIDSDKYILEPYNYKVRKIEK